MPTGAAAARWSHSTQCEEDAGQLRHTWDRSAACAHWLRTGERDIGFHRHGQGTIADMVLLQSGMNIDRHISSGVIGERAE